MFLNVHLSFEQIISSYFTAHNNRHTQRRGGHWGDRSSHASILFVRQHREPNQQNRDHWSCGQNKRFRKRVQVRKTLFIIIICE